MSTAAVPPADCATVADVRREIDRVDRLIVALIAERQGYIERAADIKSHREAVRDEARIAEVVAKVVAEGRRVGLSPHIAEPVWRTLVERSIAHEFEIFDRKQQS